jgi:hypothetical protein
VCSFLQAERERKREESFRAGKLRRAANRKAAADREAAIAEQREAEALRQKQAAERAERAVEKERAAERKRLAALAATAAQADAEWEKEGARPPAAGGPVRPPAVPAAAGDGRPSWRAAAPTSSDGKYVPRFRRREGAAGDESGSRFPAGGRFGRRDEGAAGDESGSRFPGGGRFGRRDEGGTGASGARPFARRDGGDADESDRKWRR